MTRRHRGPFDVVPASALDAPERPVAEVVAADEDPGGPPSAASVAGTPPEIAPPLLFEPIPPPTVIEPRKPAPTDPEPVVHDAYALAAAAAHQMEREGRAFDTADAALHEHDDPWPAEPEHDALPEEPDDEEDPDDEAWAAPPVARSGNDQRVRLAFAALAFVTSAVILVVSLVATLWPGDDGGDILRPVPETLGPASPRKRFAVPPANLPAAPPGSAVGFDPRTGAPAAAQGERGTVRFESDPPGATVRVDGRVLGKTPVELSLAYGSYTTELLLDGHASVRQSVDVTEPAQVVSVPLVPDQAWGRVDVVAPGWDGAVLSVDGEEHGRIPTSVVLQPGIHTFTLQRDEAQLEVRRKVWVTREAPVLVDLTR